MDKERIEQIRESKDRARSNQWDSFQSTGDPKHYTRMRGYEDIVEICDIALANADDHKAAQAGRSSMMQLAGKAEKLFRSSRGGAGYDYTDIDAFLKEVMAKGRESGWISAYD